MKNFLGRIKGFVIAMDDWIEAGRPLRDPEETRELFATHCRGGDGPPCPEFVAWKGLTIIPTGLPENGGTCAECGCFVSDDPEIVMNRVNKPTLGCPLGKWKAVVHGEDSTT